MTANGNKICYFSSVFFVRFRYIIHGFGDSFLIISCRRLLAYPKGNKVDYFSLYLEVADFESLPCGWRRYVNLRLTIVKQVSERRSVVKGDSYLSLLTNWFILLNGPCQVKCQ